MVKFALPVKYCVLRNKDLQVLIGTEVVYDKKLNILPVIKTLEHTDCAEVHVLDCHYLLLTIAIDTGAATALLSENYVSVKIAYA